MDSLEEKSKKLIFNKSQFENVLSQNVGKSVGYSGMEGSNIGILRREKGLFRKAEYFVGDEKILLDSIYFINLEEGEISSLGLHYDLLVYSRKKPTLSNQIYLCFNGNTN